MSNEKPSTANNNFTLMIDEQFKRIIPTLSAEEYQQLEKNILAEGCRDPIVTWRGTIIDGHTRYQICTEHGIPFGVIDRDFENRGDALIWMIENQMGRRNLSDFARAELAQALKPLLIEKNARNRTGRGKIIEHPANTRSEIARVAGVGSNTIARVEKICAKGVPGIIDAARENRISIRTATELVELMPDEQALVLALSENEILKKAAEIRARRSAEKAQERTTTLANQRETPTIQPVLVKADAIMWLHSLEDRSADLLLTDPPYSTHVDDIEQFALDWLPLALSKLKDDGRAYIYIGGYPREIIAYLTILLGEHRFRHQVLGWSYTNTIGPRPKEKYIRNGQLILYIWGKKSGDLHATSLMEQLSVVDVPAPDGRHNNDNKRLYRWQKPYLLAERHIRHATDSGDLVVDPFAGSGTFLLAAGCLGRRALGCDNDDDAVQIALKRFERHLTPDTVTNPAKTDSAITDMDNLHGLSGGV